MALNVNYMVRETSANLRRNPTLTLASVVTIAVSLTLVGASFLLGDAVRNATARWQGGVEVIVFLNPGVTPAQRGSVARLIDQNPLVKRKTFFDERRAYDEYRNMKIIRESPDLRVLRPDEVPTSYRVVPIKASVAVVDDLQRTFERLPGVFHVSAGTDEVRKLQRLTGVLSTGLGITASSLLFASGLLIFNTIRMAAYARRREIEVMKLVGATSWFIRIPFMLEGLVQGLIGALVAAGAVLGLNRFFESRLASNTSQSVPLLQSFGVDQSHLILTCSLLVAVGVVIGVVGSGVAVSRFVDV